MKKLLMIVFLFKCLLAMPSPDSMPQEAMPGAMPAQDMQMQSMPQPATPSPDSSQPATYDQLKWPDSIELTEGQGDVVKSDDPKIVALSKKASQLADQLKDLANKIKETADKVNQEFTRVNGVLDDFYQRIGFDEGKVKAMLK